MSLRKDLERAVADLKYIKGIVERGTGEEVPGDKPITEAIVEYVSRLETKVGSDADVIFKISVPGRPIGQPRQQFTVATKGGRQIPVPMRAKIKDKLTQKSVDHPVHAYKEHIRLIGNNNYWGDPVKTPVAVLIIAVFPRPKKMTPKGEPHYSRTLLNKTPDYDNIEKSVLDALTGIVWVDDKSCHSDGTWRYYQSSDEDPHIEIRVRTLDSSEFQDQRLFE